MNRKLLNLILVVSVFVPAIMFGMPNNAFAASGHYNTVFVGVPNLVGVDEAQNGVDTGYNMDRDRADRPSDFRFPTYGLQGNWEGQY